MLTAYSLGIALQSPKELGFGREEVEIYLRDIFSAAPDIPIQIAHPAGHGSSHGGPAPAAFADAVAAGDPRARNLYFDVASNAQSWANSPYLADMAATIRKLGTERVLFATDWPAGGRAFTRAEAWRQFQRMPLTQAEFAAIADNVMPYIRRARPSTVSRRRRNASGSSMPNSIVLAV